jgi:hypothetical protein
LKLQGNANSKKQARVFLEINGDSNWVIRDVTDPCLRTFDDNDFEVGMLYYIQISPSFSLPHTHIYIYIYIYVSLYICVLFSDTFVSYTLYYTVLYTAGYVIRAPPRVSWLVSGRVHWVKDGLTFNPQLPCTNTAAKAVEKVES